MCYSIEVLTTNSLGMNIRLKLLIGSNATMLVRFLLKMKSIKYNQYHITVIAME